MAFDAIQIRPLVAGNWKMNGLASALAEARRVREGLGQPEYGAGADAMLCPPATLMAGWSRRRRVRGCWSGARIATQPRAERTPATSPRKC